MATIGPANGSGRAPVHRFACLSVVLSVVSLASCGGGSGGSGSSGGAVRPSVPEFPVDAATARRLGGLAAPTFTAAQLEATDAALSARADTLVMSDWLFINPDAATADDLYVPRTVRCVGGTCYFAATADTGIQQLSISDLTAGEDNSSETISPVGQRNGIALAQSIDQGELDPGERYSAEAYGGWLDYSTFGILGSVFTGGDLDGWGLMYTLTYGQASGSNPTGTATWTGVAIGVDVSTTEAAGNAVQGQARITFDPQGHAIPSVDGTLYFPTVDVAFTHMYDLDAATRRPDIRWDGIRPESNGTFSTTDFVSGRIDGRFYGPDHEEVGGVFESYDILGAFGATRQ